MVNILLIAFGIPLMVASFIPSSFLSSLLVLSTVVSSTPIDRQLSKVVNLPLEIAQNRQQNADLAAEIARQVSVRIVANKGAGSGVIIGRRGQVYTVLTCAHVVNEGQGNSYSILAPDGRTYSARLVRSVQFGDRDLALVQFTSQEDYQVVEMGDSDNLSIGEQLYAGGFPNWHWVNKDEIADTRNWGWRAFRLTRGNVGMIPERSLPRGYQLGYTNEVEDGMSGGPVLNSNGQLVGINGRLKFPPQGIQVYRFADGTAPSQTLYQRMAGLSWAIPIGIFQRMVR